MNRVVIMRRPRGAQTFTAVAATLTAAAVIALLWHRTSDEPAAMALATRASVATALVMAAALANLARTTLGVRELWPVVLLLSAPGASAAASASFAPATTSWAVEGVLADLSVVTLALVLAFGAPRFLHHVSPLAAGVLVGLLPTALMLVVAVDEGAASPALRAVLTALVPAGYVVAAIHVGRHWPWGVFSRLTITSALITLGLAQALQAYGGLIAWAATTSAVAHLTAAALLSVTSYAVVDSEILADHRRLDAANEQATRLEEAARQGRADRHALLNMVAGISLASELLVDEPEVAEPVRRRLEHTIHDEARHVQELLGGGHDASLIIAAAQAHPSRVGNRVGR